MKKSSIISISFVLSGLCVLGCATTTSSPLIEPECITKEECQIGQICQVGKCVAEQHNDCSDIEPCSPGYNCVGGKCAPIDYCATMQCPAGQTCQSGVCIGEIAKVCADVECKDGEICQDDGQCVDVCGFVSCPAKYICQNGACVPDPNQQSSDPCANVNCGQNATCQNGACVQVDPCSGVSCSEGQICKGGNCIDNGVSKPDELSVGWCRIVSDSVLTSGVNVDSSEIYAQVFVANCTDAKNHCNSLVGQVGYGKAGLSTNLIEAGYTWTDAKLNPNFDGSYNGQADAGAKHDEYFGKLAGTTAGNYGFAYRFSVDGKKTWTYCSTKDSTTFDAADVGTWVVGDPVRTIDWCRLSNTNITSEPNKDTELIYGQVFSEGCTPGSNKCSGFVGQLGYVKSDGDLTRPESFTWVDASRNNDFHEEGSDVNDEYMATLKLAEGNYRIAYRFKAAADGDWTYCDLNGSNDGFSTAQMGTVSVVDPQAARTIDWCQLKSTDMKTVPGVQTNLIFAEVFSKACTPGSSKCEGFAGQLGYIPANAANLTDDTKYTWVDATRNDMFTGDSAGANDEFMALLTVPEAGDYKLAYRFRASEKDNWTYCDLNSSDDGFKAENLGTLKVAEDQKVISWCRIVSDKVVYANVNEKTTDVYAQVWVPECTEYNKQCSVLSAQIGYGAADVATADVAKKYTWSDAKFNNSYNGSGGTDHNEFMQNLTVSKEGDYGVAFRFSVDGKKTWTYCDTADDNNFNAENVVSLKVIDPSVVKKEIGWCNIQSPERLSGIVGYKSDMVYSQVYVKDCTGKANCEGIMAQVGYGDATDKEMKNFKWTSAQVNVSHSGDNNDEYMMNLTPAKTGDFAVVYRYSGDGGKTWTYCDTDGNVPGSENLFSMDQALHFDVEAISEINPTDKQASVIPEGDFSCGLVNAEAADPKRYGQIWIKDCTGKGTACNKVVNAYMLWNTSVNKDQPFDTAGGKSWQYVRTQFNTGHSGDNNDEYMAAHGLTEKGNYVYVYRFDLKNDPGNSNLTYHTVFCYMNWDGSTMGTITIQ